MIRYDRNLRRLAYCLAALAGFVDAIGFLKSGGLFVSFMSGNSTRLAVGIAQTAIAGLAAGTLIALFVLGVVLNLLVERRVARLHRKVSAMVGVAVLLVAAAVCQNLGLLHATIGLLCMAMGALNTVFRRDGEVSIGVTYMTGTLVRLGHRLADALLGGDRTAWIPYLLLWLALVGGGVAGALSNALLPYGGLWCAAGSAWLLTWVTFRLTADSAA